MCNYISSEICCKYLHPEKSQTENEIENVKDVPGTVTQTEIGSLGDVTVKNKSSDSTQIAASEEVTKTMVVGYTVICVTTSVRNKLPLKNIQKQNINKV